jgi:hypothetical protein
VKTSLEAADVPLAPEREVAFEDYVKDLTAQSFRRTWVSESRRRIANKPTNVDAGTPTGLKFAVPVALPRAAESILGRGGPSLSVSGSERISIAGTSNWNNHGSSGIGVRNSLFPQLDMRQDLDISLNGSLGDKVNVDVAQNSANTVPLSNRIGIRYKGYDDEILTNLDLGNTNLSLPGTQYVSYSGRNEGLFGAKAAARLGGTDLALVASKQEGRSERKSFQGTSQEVVRQIDDVNYIKGKYFFVQRPAEQIATNSQIEIGTLSVWVDDRQGSNDQGLRNGTAELDPTTATTDSTRSMPAGFFEQLRELTDYTVTTEYYGERFPVLVLKNALSNSQVLAISYQERLSDGTLRTVGTVPDCPADPNAVCPPVRLKLIQAPRDRLIADASGVFFETDPAKSPFYPTRDFEIKSFYDLQTSSIDPKSLVLEVRRYDAALDESNDVYREGGQSFSYLQILGVDLFADNGSGLPTPTPDQEVDQFLNSDFLDVENGILFFPDLRPFDPRVGSRPDSTTEEQFFFRPRNGFDPTVPGLRRRILWPRGAASPPGVQTTGVTPVELEANPAVYDKRNLEIVADRKYYIYAKFSGIDYSGTISLGQTNLLEGSEVLAIEGVPLERNKDYTIDYEAGLVTLLSSRARAERSRLTIDYSFAPLFAQAGRTLVGSTASFKGTDKSFGGAFIYEAKGQQELRPRLGEEPSRMFIGDLSTQFTLKPAFQTNSDDRLPFYSTTEESRIAVNGEIGVSMPNPNTQNTVYIDDFEGNRDSYSAPMSRGFWKWASPPLVNAPGGIADTVAADYTELIWYNPYNTVEAGDLNPKLTRNEGRENIVTALDLYIPKTPNVRVEPSMWTGITTTVEPDGTDFSRMQYLELWVNDWRDPDVRQSPNLKLHVDLGTLSEDQQRAPGVPPNGLFDTEDKNKDNKYDPPGSDILLREDGGADGLPDALETDLYDLSTASETDKHGDNYAKSPVSLADDSNELARFDPKNYVLPTLSEKAKGTFETGSSLYSEDLNGNQILDNGQDANVYVSYTLPLGDEAALAPFIIFSAESTLTNEGLPVDPNKGWRRMRIPLDVSDPAIRQVIRNGSLSTVKHMRVWLEGFESFQGDAAAPKTSEFARGRQPLLQIATIDVVGNRWRIAGTDSALTASAGSIVARNVNNQEDRNIYDPPFEVETQSRAGSSQTQREQSLALEVTRLPVGSVASIFKDQTLAEDYTRYSRLGFYTTQFGFTNEDSARFFVRLGYDERNYYEYSRPIRDAFPGPFRPTPWQNVTFDLTQLTNVKLHRPSGAVVDSIEVAGTGERYKVVGSPTFTRTQRLTLGVYSEKAITDSSAFGRAQTTMSGQVWIDDLRALDVDRSRGVANRLTVDTKLADLLSFTTNWDRTDQNFQRLGQTRPPDGDNDRLSFSGQFAPHRLMGTSGISLPITFSWARNGSTPRLRTGTDVFLSGADAADERSRSVDRSLGLTFSKTGDRNPILRNTIGRISLNFSFADRVNRSPTSADSSRTLSAGGSYSLSPAEWFKIPLPLWKVRGQQQKLAILPQTISISYGQTTNHTFTYRRGLEDPVGQYAMQSDIFRKTAQYSIGGNWRPLPFGSYSFTSTRNANIPDIEPLRIFGINFGRMTNFGQRMDARFTIPVVSFFKPAFDFSTSYGEGRTPDLSPNLTLGSFQNGTNSSVSFDLPFARLAQRRTAPPQPIARSAADSTRRDSVRVAGPGFGDILGRTIARLGTVSVRGSFTRTTSFARFTGVPSVPYRLGLVRNPDTQWDGVEIPSIFRGPQATTNAQRTISGEASSTIGLYGRTTARVRGSFTNTNRLFNAQTSNNQTIAFPDFSVDWGSMTHVLRVGGIFNSLNAQSRFNRTTTTEGLSLSNPQSRVQTSNFQPLLSFTGTTKGTAQVLVTVDRQSSLREDFLTRRSVRRESVTNVRASISRSYLPGQKLPILASKGLKSTLTLQLDGSYNKRKGSTEATGQGSLRSNSSGMQLNSSATYSFSSYVFGTINLGFTQNRDNQSTTIDGKPSVNRSVRLEGAATIRF